MQLYVVHLHNLTLCFHFFLVECRSFAEKFVIIELDEAKLI